MRGSCSLLEDGGTGAASARAWLLPVRMLLVPVALLVPGALLAADLSAGGWLVYLGTYTGPSSKGIYLSRMDEKTGRLSTPQLAAETENPSFLALHPDGRHLYAVNELEEFGNEPTGAASAFAVEPATGRLRFLGQVGTGGKAPAHLTVDPRGRHLLVANYGGGSLAVLPIRADGSLAPPSQVVKHEGHGPNLERQRGPHVHSVMFDPAGGRLWSADLGLDEVAGYAFDAARGTLGLPPGGTAKVAPGAGPRHLAMTRDGRHLFVLNELALTVSSFGVDPRTGTASPEQTLSTLPEGTRPAPGYKAAELVLHPSGRFLYASNRGADSMALFSVDAGSARLRLVEVVPSGGKTPRGFAVDPAGRFLVAANQDSSAVVVFRIDPETGRLSRTGDRVEVGSPVSVLFAPGVSRP
jgi:6-phosphogluconolactonase